MALSKILLFLFILIHTSLCKDNLHEMILNAFYDRSIDKFILNKVNENQTKINYLNKYNLSQCTEQFTNLLIGLNNTKKWAAQGK